MLVAISDLSQPLQGKIFHDDRSELMLWRVQIVDLAGMKVIAEKNLAADGSFVMTPLPVGLFEFRLVGAGGDIRYSREIHTGQETNIEVRMGYRSGGILSASRLQHKTPKQARKALQAAQKAHQKRDWETSIGYLKEAGQLDPDNFDVAGNLGAILLQLKRDEEALPYLEKASRIDPTDSQNNLNLALYHARKGNYEVAEALARAGMRSEPNSQRGLLLMEFLKKSKPY